MIVLALGAVTNVLTDRSDPVFIVLLSLSFTAAFCYILYLCLWDKGKVGKTLTACLAIIPVAISVLAIISHAGLIELYITIPKFFPIAYLIVVYHLPLVFGIMLCKTRDKSTLILLMVSMAVILLFLMNAFCYAVYNFRG